MIRDVIDLVEDSIPGPPGPQGKPGPAGVTSVSSETLPAGSEATVSLDNQKLHIGIPKGDKGDTGDAATITVGNVTTGEVGSDAQVTNTGDEHNAVLDFTFPRGVKGDKGDTPTISVGSVTSGDTANVSNSGTDTAAVFDFTIPKGDKGDAGTVSVGEVETLPAGSQAQVTNTGTTTDAVLKFSIPRGDKGEGLALDYTADNVGSLPTGSVTVGQTGIVNGVLYVWNGSQWLEQGQMQGAPGEPGKDGEPGKAATITVGTVNTGEPGSQVQITNSGSENAAVLNFTIPKGADGAQGEKGADGTNGADGKDGVTPEISMTATVDDATGIPSVQVSKSGTTEAPSFAFSFTNLKGANGANGSDGQPGADGKDAVVTTIPVTFEKSLFNSGLSARKQVTGLGSVNLINAVADKANVAVIQAAAPILAQDHGDDSTVPKGYVKITVGTAPTADMKLVITVLRSE